MQLQCIFTNFAVTGYNKLCAWRHNILRPARCTLAAAYLESIANMPYACGAQRALRVP